MCDIAPSMCCILHVLRVHCGICDDIHCCMYHVRYNRHIVVCMVCAMFHDISLHTHIYVAFSVSKRTLYTIAHTICALCPTVHTKYQTPYATKFIPCAVYYIKPSAIACPLGPPDNALTSTRWRATSPIFSARDRRHG